MTERRFRTITVRAAGIGREKALQQFFKWYKCPERPVTEYVAKPENSLAALTATT